MSSQALRDARRYEEIYEKEILTEQRPLFHLAPRCGWMNDPNGFGFYNGSCHLFYQYYPYASEWRSMHWGHATSRDFLHWDYLPAALAPDQSYDYMGCFSGSAIESDDGKHVLMYTSVKMAPEMQDEGIGIQTQSIAIGDGIDYEKYSGNPVLTEEDLPEGGSRYDFRDPKVWKAADGSYICAVANRAADNTGAILLYKSTDLFHWKYWKVLAANHGRFGAMWECPDFFELDGKHVLLVSPQDMQPSGFEYHNGNGTLCLIGSYDEATGTFSEEKDQAIDYGIDFYALQTILSEDGRRIMIGWMQNWDACAIRNKSELWGKAGLNLLSHNTLDKGSCTVKPLHAPPGNLLGLKTGDIYLGNAKVRGTLDPVYGDHPAHPVVLHLTGTAANVALPFVHLAAITLVANIFASTLALPTDNLASCLTLLAFRCSLAATPLALSPLVFNFCSTATVTMGTSHFSRTLTHIAAYLFLA